jgi:CDP-diacylglycerol---glycerol-3-phosphate 3-phosphatidyltransferase
MSAMTVSTRITLLRIALIPLLVWLILVDRRLLAAAVFLVASATDYLDGYLARRWQQVTDLGNFLDTTADKLLITGALLALLPLGRVSVWVAFVVVAREIAILGLRAVAAGVSVVISASMWGKVKFVVQVVGITLAILRPGLPVGPLLLDQWCMLVVALVTALSAVDYFSRFGDLLTAPPRQPEPGGSDPGARR